MGLSHIRKRLCCGHIGSDHFDVSGTLGRHDLSCDEGLPRWAMITLSIHSDLEAVGFLAAITTVLAAIDIPVNAVSAYYHDHTFVPYEHHDDALECLRCMMRETNCD